MSGDAYFAWLHNHKAESACECDCLARAAAFAAGVEHGLSMDAYALAVHDMTRVATMLNDRRTLESGARLARFVTWVEDRVDEESESLQPSAYWSS